MSEREPRHQIDKRRMRAAFDRSAQGYDAAAVLQRTIGERLLERLDLVRLEPGWVLDLGTGTGDCLRPLRRRFRGARVLGLDIAYGMLRHARAKTGWLSRPHLVCGDAEYVPLATSSVDLVCSNLTLQWCNDPDLIFRELARILRPGGLLLFSTFGPDTLRELRASWGAVDGYSHVSAFVDMHDLGDALLRACLVEPVMDMEHVTLTYQGLESLMHDIKAWGAYNATAGRPRGLMGRSRLQALRRAYEAFRRDGRLPATYEVVYGTAWAPSAHGVTKQSVAIPRPRREHPPA